MASGLTEERLVIRHDKSSNISEAPMNTAAPCKALPINGASELGLTRSASPTNFIILHQNDANASSPSAK